MQKRFRSYNCFAKITCILCCLAPKSTFRTRSWGPLHSCRTELSESPMIGPSFMGALQYVRPQLWNTCPAVALGPNSVARFIIFCPKV